MRLFIAVNLPEEERERIHEAVAPLRDAGLPVRWIPADGFHLTLKFLGEVRSEFLEPISGVVDRVTSETGAFHVDIHGVGAFPTIRRPQVLWIGVEPSPALRCLKQDLEWALADHGFGRETRAFHPHITLGRAHEADGAGAFRGLDDLAAAVAYRGRMDVAQVSLMRSHLSRKGNRYSELRVSPLKVAGSGR